MSYKYESHRFFCINCGEETIPVQRRVNHKHSKHHLKKLYCWHCKQDVNCVECRNDEEIQEFRSKWKAGEYQEALQESLEIIAKENKVWS